MAKKYVKLKGKVNYFTPNMRSNFSTPEEPFYDFQITNLEEYPENADTLKMLEMMDARVRPNDKADADKYPERGKFITSKSIYPIKTVDTKKRLVPTTLKFGNGTLVNAVFEVYQGKNGTGLGIRNVQVLELVKYDEAESKDSLVEQMFADEEGFEIPADAVPEASEVDQDDLNDEIPF